MPLLKVMTAREIAIAREEAVPVLNKVTHLLLRAGVDGLLDFQCDLFKECDTEKSTSASCSAHVARVNPEGLKAILRHCGVLLAPDEYRAILLAYCDLVGFVLVSPLLAALSPIGGTSAPVEAAVRALFPGTGEPAITEDTDVLPVVSLDSVLALLCSLFAPVDGDAAEAADLNERLQTAYEEAAVCFTLEKYPAGAVPGENVVAFLGAILSAGPDGAAFATVVLSRLRAEKDSLAPASGLGAATAHSGATSPLSTATGRSGGAAFSMVHTGVRSNRQFERYRDESRLDEWLRGRDEPEARQGYRKHVVGYGGHLPEYRYHFGRTFHVIEEDLPELTRPKAALEPVVADAFGQSRELKNSRMSAHHYRFS